MPTIWDGGLTLWDNASTRWDRTTVVQAYKVLRGIMAAGITDVPIRWQNENDDSQGNRRLPDEPSPFVYVEFLTDPGDLVAFGGGPGANLYRHPGRLEIYCFVPRGVGLIPAIDLAERCATLYRSYRDDDVLCTVATAYPGGDGATIQPPGISSEVANYFYAVTEVDLKFDLIG